VWSRDFLQPLAPGALTPFSASVLHEMGSRSWYSYFDRLGFEPTPRARVVRSLHGRPYFTLTLSAQLDAQGAGIEPPALRIDGSVRPLARWEKPGLLAGLKLGGHARKVTSALQALDGEIDAAAAKGQAWLQRVQAMHWSQAEILQIMEEIERVGAGTLQLYVAARHNLQSAYLRLLSLLDGVSSPQQLAALNLALRPETHDQAGLVELQIANGIARLAQTAGAVPAVVAYLQAGNFHAWESQLPSGSFADGLATFLAAYGHRGLGEGELMAPRWSENPAALLALVAAALHTGAALPTPGGPDDGPLMAALDGKRRKDAQALLQQARLCLRLQSKALHVHAYTLAGTRIWALAAGREAMGDNRLLREDDVFFYELEEMKQMMTGEWNISDTDGIRARAAKRKLEWQAGQEAVAPNLLVGEAAAFAEIPTGASGLPGAEGAGVGTIAPAGAGVLPSLPAGGKAILVGVQADVGWAAALPVAAGLVLQQGSPLDPIVAAASALHVPVVVDAGDRMTSFAAGQTAAIDGSRGTINHAA
jgi:pyruvate,water dikinase